MYQTRIITDLAEEPVSLAEAKAFMEIDFSTFDPLITRLIKSSRIASERFTGLSYGKKEIELVSNSHKLQIPLGPFKELVSIKDKDGVAISTNDYSLFGFDNPILTVFERRVCRDNYNYDPYYDILGTALRSEFQFTIVYYAGFYTEDYPAEPVNALPEDLKTAICMRVETGFQYRADGVEEAVNKSVSTSTDIEFGYRVSPMVQL